MSEKKARDSYFIINLVTSIIAATINYGINFMLAPYLVSTVGSEAYGFVNLANNMVNYAAIITIALNSVAGRYITIMFHKGEKEKAGIYFNSVLLADIIMAVIVFVTFLPIIMKLEYVIEIPEDLIHSVKQLYFFVVINFLITVISNVFNIATYVKNMLYLTSIGNCLGALIRVFLLLILFGCFPVNVAYISLSMAVASIFLAVYNYFFTKKLIDIRINWKKFSYRAVKELMASGIWSSVTKLSQILSDGLDLLVCNLGIGAYEMGQLSIAYTIPTIFSGLLSHISALFAPQQTYYYARGENDNVIKNLKYNMKFSAFFSSVICAGVIVYGREFFCLYVPGENINLIYQLSCIAICSVLFSGATSGLNNVFLLTDHLKENAVVWLVAGMFEAVLVIVLIMNTNFGIYAVAGVSKIVGAVLNMTYLPLYASKCLKVSKKTFYPTIIHYMIDVGALCTVFFMVKAILPKAENIQYFAIDILIVGGIGVLFNSFFLLEKKERKYMMQILKMKGRKNTNVK